MIKQLSIAIVAISTIGGYSAGAVEPGDDCDIPGVYLRENDTNAAYHLVCDGNQWNLNLTLHKDGPVGIGTMNPSSGLTLDVEGKVGATNYCDQNGENCFTAGGVGGGNAAAAGPEGAIQFNNSGVMSGDVSFVFTSTGRVGIGTGSPESLLHANGTVTAQKFAIKNGSQTLTIAQASSSGVGFSIGKTEQLVWGGIHIGNAGSTGQNSVSLGGKSSAIDTIAIGISAVSDAQGEISIGRTAGYVSGGINGGEHAIMLGHQAQASANEFGVTPRVSKFTLWGEGGGFQSINRVVGLEREYISYTNRAVYEGRGKLNVYRNNNNSQTFLQADSSANGPIVGIGGTAVAGSALTTTAPHPSYIGTAIKGAASQAANLQEWQNSSGAALAVVSSSGAIAIGKSTPAYPLDVVGDIALTGQIHDVSDRRLKDKIRPLDAGQLKKLLTLQGVSFVMQESDQTELGLIAQDVEPNFPELVQTRSDGMKTLSYLGFIAPMIEAFKEQQTQLEILQEQVDLLQTQLRQISSQDQPE